MAAVTPWFSPGKKPVRVGLYERLHPGPMKNFIGFAWWNGFRWGKFGATESYALMFKSHPDDTPMKWRGILKT